MGEVIEMDGSARNRVSRSGGSGPTGFSSDGGDMGSRVTRLEVQMEHVETDISDIKKDLRQILWVALGTYVAVAAAYLLLSSKIDSTVDKLQTVIERISIPNSALPSETPKK